MSRAPVKPRAQKASAAIADVPKRKPSKRAPKRAVAVENKAEAVAPSHVSANSLNRFHAPMAGYAKVDKPKSSRERMLESQRALHESFRDDVADAKDYAAENAKNRREAHITAMYAFGVVGFIFFMGVAVYFWGWK